MAAWDLHKKYSMYGTPSYAAMAYILRGCQSISGPADPHTHSDTRDLDMQIQESQQISMSGKMKEITH